jgi:hypothetical protein
MVCVNVFTCVCVCMMHIVLCEDCICFSSCVYVGGICAGTETLKCDNVYVCVNAHVFVCKANMCNTLEYSISAHA